MRCPDCTSRNSVAAKSCSSCGHKFKRKPAPKGFIVGAAVAALGLGLWIAGSAIIPSLTDPEQNLARVAKQLGVGPKNSDENKRMREDFDRAVKGYLSKLAGLPTPEIVKKLQKALPVSLYEVHAVELPRGLRIVEIDTVLQASDYLIMKGSSGNKVVALPGIEVFDDARLINESAGPMLVAIGHSGGQPPHHPQVKVFALLPDDITDETEKLLPPIRGEGIARFAKNGKDIVLDLSLMSLAQLEQLFAPGVQSEDGTAHQNLDWKEAHYTSRYEYGSSPFTALYAVARCMRYPDLTATHRQFLGPKGEQLVRENKSQDAGSFRVKRLASGPDLVSYLMTASVGSFAVDVQKVNGVWSVAGTRNTPANISVGNAPAQPPAVAAQTAPVTTAPIEEKKIAEPIAAQIQPEPAKAIIVEKKLSVPDTSKSESGNSKAKAEREAQRVAEQKAAEQKAAEKKHEQELAQAKAEQEKFDKLKKEQARKEAERKEAQRLETEREKSKKQVAKNQKNEAEKKVAIAASKPAEADRPTSNSAAIAQGQVTAVGTVNLRSGPNTTAKPVTSVTKGAPVEIVGKENGWYKVRYQGQEGFIYAGLVDFKKPDAYTTATLTKERHVTDHHKKSLGKPQVGDRVVILGGLENNKYKVQLANGKTGYVDKDAVNVSIDEPQFVP